MIDSSNTTAVILAGGEGTRLKKKFSTTPKVLLKFNGQSNLENIVRCLLKNNILKIIFIVHHNYEKIKKHIYHLKKKYSINLELYYESIPRGTGGTLLDLKKKIKNNILVIYGDLFININFLNFFNFITCKKYNYYIFTQLSDHPFESDLIEMNNKNILKKIHKYPHKNLSKNYFKYSCAAIYFFKYQSLDNINFTKKKVDISKDIIQRLILLKKEIYCYNSYEFNRDFGTPSQYSATLNEIKNNVHNLYYFDSNRKLFLIKLVFDHKLLFLNKKKINELLILKKRGIVIILFFHNKNSSQNKIRSFNFNFYCKYKFIFDDIFHLEFIKSNKLILEKINMRSFFNTKNIFFKNFLHQSLED